MQNRKDNVELDNNGRPPQPMVLRTICKAFNKGHLPEDGY
jgi:hypothetical protein